MLPLIDNSVYTGLAAALGGKPEPLDALPVPKANIFSVNFRLNKEALHRGPRGLFAGKDAGPAADLALLGVMPG